MTIKKASPLFGIVAAAMLASATSPVGAQEMPGASAPTLPTPVFSQTYVDTTQCIYDADPLKSGGSHLRRLVVAAADNVTAPLLVKQTKGADKKYPVELKTGDALAEMDSGLVFKVSPGGHPFFPEIPGFNSPANIEAHSKEIMDISSARVLGWLKVNCILMHLSPSSPKV